MKTRAKACVHGCNCADTVMYTTSHHKNVLKAKYHAFVMVQMLLLPNKGRSLLHAFAQ